MKARRWRLAANGCRLYDEFMRRLRGLGLETPNLTMPVEIPDAIPFELDKEHASYDRGDVTRFWRILVQADRVLKRFRAQFLGKASPVHFFWGSFGSGGHALLRDPGAQIVGRFAQSSPWVMQDADTCMK